MSTVLIIFIILFAIFGVRLLKFLFGLFFGLFGLVGVVILFLLNIFFPNGIINFLRKGAQESDFGFGDSRPNNSPELDMFYVQIIACIAKLDGVISNNEALWISEELTRCARNNLHRNQLKSVFNEAKNTPNIYTSSAQKIAALRPNQMQKKAMLDSLFQLAIIDGLNSAKISAILEVASIWRMQAYARLVLEQLGIYQGKNNNYSRSSEIDESAALKRLGLSQGASFDEIKRAYRRLAREYHPDTLGSQNLSPSELERRTQKFREINEAYELLKKKYSS